MARRPPAPNQLTFDYPRATKLWMLERLPCPARVKSVLKAIDSIARDNAQADITLRRLAMVIGLSTKTVRRHVQETEGLGFLSVDRTNQSASTYKIAWLPIFETTGPTPSQTGSPPSQIGSPPPPKLGVPPSQFGRGAPPPTITTNTRPFHGGNSGGNPEGKSLGREESRKGEPSSLGSVLGAFPATTAAQPSTPNPKHDWIGNVEPRDLIDVDHLRNVARKASAAGVIPPGRDGLLIVLAASHHVRHAPDVKNPGALFVSIVEGKSRFRLTTPDYDHARAVVRTLSPVPAPA